MRLGWSSMNDDTKLLKEKVVDFDGGKYRIWKAEVNVANSHRSIRVFIKKQDENT